MTNYKTNYRFYSGLLACLFALSCSFDSGVKSEIEKEVRKEFLTKDSTLSEKTPSDKWWMEFNDETLNQLVDLGLQNNKDIQIANLAIITSRQLNNIDAIKLLPSGSVGVGRQRFASPGFGPSGVRYDLFQSTMDASWELDFFGKNLDRYKGGKMRFLKEAQLYKATSLRVAGEIAQNYITLKSLQKQIANLAKITELKNKLITIAEQKEKNGIASKTNIYKAKIDFDSASSTLIETKTNEKVLTYKLAVLIGTTPEKISEILGNTSKKEIFDYSSGVVPVGLKSDILQRRPDIVAAFYEVEAAGFDQSAQLKEFFPSFNLTARIGGGSKDFGSMLKDGANVKDVRGAVSLPIFSAGSLIAEYKISKAKTKITVVDYEKAVLNAIEDLESQLVRYVNALQIENNASHTLESSNKILQISRNKKTLGAISSEELLNSEVAQIQSENQLAQKKSDSLINLITLHKALGGGFEGYEMHFEKDRVVWVKTPIRDNERSNTNDKK